MRYKCDKCGDTIYVDPGDERICDTCTQKIRIKAKEQENYYERWRKTGGNAIVTLLAVSNRRGVSCVATTFIMFAVVGGPIGEALMGGKE